MKFSKGDIICREDLGYPEGAMVCDGCGVAGGVLAHRLGGGFQLTIPAGEERRFRVVAEEERDAALFGKGKFAMTDAERAFDGWSNGQLWNGWEMPGFEFQVCKEILAWMGDDKARYDGDRDVFITANQDGEEIWPAESIAIRDGTRIKVYGLGAGSWTWEEV
jgi:hypothetical protein